MSLDLAAICDRATAAEQWVRRDPCNADGFDPLSFREHFNHDVPALLAEIERLRAALDEIRLLHIDSSAGVCPSCARLGDVSDTDDGLVNWPCPTVQAIHAATGTEVSL